MMKSVSNSLSHPGKTYFKIIQNDYRNGKYESAGGSCFLLERIQEKFTNLLSWKAPVNTLDLTRDQNQRGICM